MFDLPILLQIGWTSLATSTYYVLFAVAFGSFTQVENHRIDVVFQLGHFAAGFDLNRTGQITFGHSGGNVSDGANAHSGATKIAHPRASTIERRRPIRSDKSPNKIPPAIAPTIEIAVTVKR